MGVSVSDQMNIVEAHRRCWLQLHTEYDSHLQTYTFPSLSSALGWVGRDTLPIEQGVTDYQRIPNDTHVQVFATGSLYLVGNSFAILNEQIY